MKKYKYVLFDLDGTLMNTSEGVLKSIDYTIKNMDLPDIPLDIKKTFIGPPIKNSLKSYFNLTEEQAARATEVFRNVYKDKFLLHAEVYDGIFELLFFLHQSDIKIGVATYKRDDYAQKLLNIFKISQKCDFILGSDMNNVLTKSDIVKLCLENLGCHDFSHVVLIGDTPHDAIGAQESCVDFIAVTYGFGFKFKEHTIQYDPVFIAENPTDIIGFLKS